MVQDGRDVQYFIFTVNLDGKVALREDAKIGSKIIE